MQHLQQRLSFYWRLFWRFRIIQIHRMLQYRGEFLFWTGVSLIWTFYTLFFFNVLANLGSNGIAGWSAGQMQILVGFFLMFDAFTWSFFFHNMRNYTTGIYSGQLSLVLMKPVDPQFLISTSTNSYTNSFRMLAGIVTLIYAFQQQHIIPTLESVILCGVLLFVSLLLFYSLWFMLATCAFWFEKLDGVNEVVPEFRRVFNVPRSIFTGVGQAIFAIIIPLGLVVSLPVEVLLGQREWGLIAWYCCFTVALFVASRRIFFFSLRRYTATGG